MRGLVLISPPILGNEIGLLPEEEPAMRRLFEVGRRAATEGIGVFKPIVQDYSRSSPEMIEGLLSPHDPSSAGAFFQGIDLERKRQPFDHLEELHVLTMPCLILPGSDAIHPAEVGEAYLRVIPQAQSVFLPEEASLEERVRFMATELAPSVRRSVPEKKERKTV